jgi:hypothetical protein
VPDTPAHEHHAVKFYENEASLFTTVAGFLGQGLVDDQPAILIATESHRTSILRVLRSRLINVRQAERNGDLIVLDAHETLASFMIGDEPDAERFEATVGTVIARLLKRRPENTLIRAYGEMVDVLWKQGRSSAAIRLEILWNKLAARYNFALLCGYSMGNFYKETSQFEDVCRQHAHVVPPDTPTMPVAPRYSLR